ncbi:hypothetical protein MPNE_0507 [Mycoplasmoides pneumoniae FH]|uniref:Uncharacterized protein n=1 Tax=Mycoplasmoides pneumoniae (strain ATCC 15531 / DSM 23978 / CIP 103766 / NBRC 14401 / NCTC 10119 / FH) TaxID=722438 RepID=A0A0H3DL94_MYCPB|nr:hypothetical protein MPNE_0507 [Mycoplasmoides pneumoniae FH]
MTVARIGKTEVGNVEQFKFLFLNFKNKTNWKNGLKSA